MLAYVLEVNVDEKSKQTIKREPEKRERERKTFDEKKIILSLNKTDFSSFSVRRVVPMCPDSAVEKVSGLGLIAY
jgi:hypothetical protein